MPQPQRNRPASISADFTKVEDRKGGGVHVPPGDYILEIKDYEIKAKKDDASRTYINWQLAIISPEAHVGTGTIYHVTSLVPESLWNLRNFLEDMGVKVPKKMVDIPLAKLIGKQIGATLEDDEYNGKIKSKIAATFNKNDLGGSEPEEEAEDATPVAAAITTGDDDTEELDLDEL